MAAKEIKRSRLSKQDKKFCRVYVDSRNASKASRDAGYETTDHGQYGYALLKKAQIKEHIRKLDDACRDDLLITAHSTIRRLVARASTSIAHFTVRNPDGTLTIDMSKCSDGELQGLVQYKHVVKANGDVIHEIKLCDREKNEEMIAKRLGMFELDNKQQLPVVLSDEVPNRG